jgi:hypothetical protein
MHRAQAEIPKEGLLEMPYSVVLCVSVSPDEEVGSGHSVV